MADHPNFIRAQATWDAIGRGDFSSALDDLADDVVVDNGPGAGPWRHVEGKDAFVEFVLAFVPQFGDSWHQAGTCLYADDAMTVSLVHETGTAPSGDRFDNRAIWVSRLAPDGATERIWTVDVDAEAVEEFWRRNPLTRDT